MGMTSDRIHGKLFHMPPFSWKYIYVHRKHEVLSLVAIIDGFAGTGTINISGVPYVE